MPTTNNITHIYYAALVAMLDCQLRRAKEKQKWGIRVDQAAANWNQRLRHDWLR